MPGVAGEQRAGDQPVGAGTDDDRVVGGSAPTHGVKTTLTMPSSLARKWA